MIFARGAQRESGFKAVGQERSAFRIRPTVLRSLSFLRAVFRRGRYPYLWHAMGRDHSIHGPWRSGVDRGPCNHGAPSASDKT